MTPRLGLLAVAALLVACEATPPAKDGPHPARSEPTGSDVQRAGGRIPSPGPADIPILDLSATDRDVRELLESRSEALRSALESGATGADLLEPWAALGRAYLAQGFDGAAASTFAVAERLAPSDHRWPYLRAHALRRESRNREARDAFVRAASLAPDDVPSLVWVAESEAALENAEAAARAATRALEVDPDNAMALFRAGQLAAEDADFESAVRLLGRALEVQPNADRIHLPLALALRELGRIEEAEAQLGRAGDRKPGQSDPLLAAVQAETTGAAVLINAGGLAFRRGDLREAIELLHRAVQVAPENATAHSNLGATLLMAGRAPAARSHFERAVELDPGDAEARFNLGTFFGGYEEDEPAIEHLSRAISLDPEHHRARFNLANALRRQGRCAEAIPHYERLLAGSPADRAARLARADCLVASARWDEARLALEEAERLAPDDAPLLSLHARFLACCPEGLHRNGARAVELARRAVRIQPIPEHGRNLALAYFEAGDREQALHWARGTLDAAIRAGASRTATSLEQTLREIENGYPCRTP